MDTYAVMTSERLQGALARAEALCSRAKLVSLVAVLCVWIAGVYSFAEVGEASKTNTVKITVQVLDPASAEGKLLPRATESQAGKPVVHFNVEKSDSTIKVLTNSLLVLRATQSVKFTNESPGVLETPKEMYMLPNGVVGIFRAKKVGTAVLDAVAPVKGEMCVLGTGQCSANWAGYVLRKADTIYTGVTGQWTVPGVGSDSPHGNSESWVGIGGGGSGTSVLQAGTGQDCHPWYEAGSCPIYYAWFELFPALPVLITPVRGLGDVYPTKTQNPIHSGDVVQVSITPPIGSPTPVPGKKNEFTILFTDVTQKWKYSTNVSYSGDLTSAEWIEEAPSEPNLVPPGVGEANLDDYAQVEFDFNDKVALNGGALGSPGFAAADAVSMNQGGLNGIYSTPSIPSGDQSGFYVTWTIDAPNQVFPPGPWIQTTSLPPALSGSPYSQQLVVNQAATPVWTLVGSLPSPLTLSPQGVLSGTTIASGAFKFDVYATDTTTGAFTAQQPLILNIETDPASSLEVDCEGILPPTAGTGLAVNVDGVAAQCNVAGILSLGLHTVAATVTGTTQLFKVTYAGACNSTGQVTLASGTVAMCSVSATLLGTAEGACPSGEHCCEPSANGCLKCLPTKMSCP